MTAEIIHLAERRNKRIVRIIRRSPADGFNPALVIPAAALAGLALWGAIIVNVIALASHARPPD